MRDLRRLRKGVCGAVFFVLVAMPSHARGEVFHPEIHTLANGLQVVVVPNALAEAVAHMVWYKVGAVDDPEGKTGLAHYLEHMMFKGTERLQSGAFSTLIASLGGRDNAFTSHDATAYHVTVSAEHLGLVMLMEAERMRSLRLDEAEAANERDVVFSERQERTDNDPVGLFQEKFNALFYGKHVYGRPVIGWGADIRSFTASDARDFYRRYYAPDNAILVVSGNVSPKDVLRLADGVFGRLAASGVRGGTAPASAVPLPDEKRLVMRDSRVKQPFYRHHILAPAGKDDLRQSAALEVLAEVLSGEEVGLLYRRFVMEKKRASAIDASYDSVRRGPPVFSVAASPAEGAGVEELEKEVASYMRKLARKGVSSRPVEAAKKRMTDAAVFARDSLMAPAQILGEALAVGLPVSAVEEWPDRVASVTAAEVNEALRKLLAEKRVLTGFLLPEESP